VLARFLLCIFLNLFLHKTKFYYGNSFKIQVTNIFSQSPATKFDGDARSIELIEMNAEITLYLIYLLIELIINDIICL
jgi:hypothetical protein